MVEENNILNIQQLEKTIRELQAKIEFYKNELLNSQAYCLNIETQLKLEISKFNSMAKLTDEASVTKNTFLANIGHEFRTPLQAIMGFTDMLMTQKNISLQNQQIYLDIVNKRSQDLLRLVDDLLDISKIEARKISLVTNNIKFRNLMNEIKKIFIKEIKDKKIKYNINIEKNIPKYLYLDALRLKQILVNLIKNAIKFTNLGGINVNVSKIFDKDLEETNRIKIEFCVADTGIGIPKNKQFKLFEPFSQVQNLTQTGYGGAGLGLAISKNLSEIMGGTIWMEDNIPCGSRFLFTVVANIKKTIPLLLTKNLETVEYNTEDIWQNIKINLMIVEDDEYNLKYLQLMIKNKYKNINIISATNGQMGVEFYKNKNIDIIISDIQMPNMNGLSMMQQIRSIEKNTGKHITIMAVTAFASKNDEIRCLEAGADYYMAKPVDKKYLYLIINMVAEKKIKI